MGERKRSEHVDTVEQDPPARAFLNYGRWTRTSRISSQSSVHLSPLTVAIIDKGELHLTANQISPDMIFVKRVIARSCHHREGNHNDFSVL